MVDTGIPVPTGKCVAFGTPPIVTPHNVETATNMYAGRLVKRGTTDRDIVVNGAEGTPIGWLGYEQGDAYRPATVGTIYEAGDEAPVIRGGGFIPNAKLAASQTIVKGDRLVPAADGMLQKATAIAGVVPGSTGDTTPVTSTSAKPAITMSGDVGALPVVAIAEETVTTTSTAANILVRSLI
jgi:hypothetical protein